MTLDDLLHDTRIRLTEIIQDSRSGMPRARVLAEVRQLAQKLLGHVMREEDPPRAATPPRPVETP